MATATFEQRETFSATRLIELRNRLRCGHGRMGPPQRMVVVVVGSYARLEASKYSDVDLFLLDNGSQQGTRQGIGEFRLLGTMTRPFDEVAPALLSNDFQCPDPTANDPVLRHLGKPIDDSSNGVALWVQLLLDSRPLLDSDGHASIQRAIVDFYYRDYADRNGSHAPWRLANDICRSWKTLLLAHESARITSSGYEAEKDNYKVSNFELRYSQMTTRFATIAAMGSVQESLTAEELLSIVSQTPRQRLEYVAMALPSVAQEVSSVIHDYAWFLELAAQSEPQLRAQFADEERRSELFTRARNYGTLMLDLMAAIDARRSQEDSRLLRLLII